MTSAHDMLQWLSLLFIGLLWLSFEGYMHAWKFLQPILQDLSGRQIKDGHRALFCVTLSLVGGILLMLQFTSVRLNVWSFAFWLLYGLMIHASWERGATWCRRRLGIHPVRYDPKRPYDNLDLGN